MPQKFSNSVKLYGFGVLKNGVKFDFPYRESVLSMEPITEQIYFALGDSEDTTNDEFKKFESEVGFSIKSGSSSSLFNASLAHKWQQES